MASDSVNIVKMAKEAYVGDKIELAIDLYSKAIELNTTNPHLYADRSQAYIKLSNFTDAAADANRAIELDPTMVKAYLCKGTACMKLEEYETAKAAFAAGAALAPGNFRFRKHIKECEQHIAAENATLSNLLVEQLTEETALYGGLHSYSDFGGATAAPAAAAPAPAPVNYNNNNNYYNKSYYYFPNYFPRGPVEYDDSSSYLIGLVAEKPTQSTVFSQGSNSYSQTTAPPPPVNRHRFMRRSDSCADEDASLPDLLVEKPTESSVISKGSILYNNIAKSTKPRAKPSITEMHKFYQTPEEIVVTIFAEGVSDTDVNVIFGEQIISVTIDVPGKQPYLFQPWLFGKIIAEKCTYEVLSTNIEIHLTKAEAKHWTSLEYPKAAAVAPTINTSTPATQRPSYPSPKLKLS